MKQDNLNYFGSTWFQALNVQHIKAIYFVQNVCTHIKFNLTKRKNFAVVELSIFYNKYLSMSTMYNAE